MTTEAFIILLGTAASIAFTHTLIGIDHTLPFIVIGKSRQWSINKVLFITLLCGLGHVLSSVIIGFVGIGFGVALNRLTFIESMRGDFAANLLIGFGLAYATWSFINSKRGIYHTHSHIHSDGQSHEHQHCHKNEHIHLHNSKDKTITSWSLFIIFVFGPCEALIPLLMVPAAKHNWFQTTVLAVVFGLTTMVTMIATVALGYTGFKFFKFNHIEKYANVYAGLAITASGGAIRLLGI